jgi:glyoxylase-like metal-dependent hydrolase (beta-lactamase superfamily II)
VAAYVLTHSHLDHFRARRVVEQLPAPVAMHPEENDWAFCEKNAWLPNYPQTRKVAITARCGTSRAFQRRRALLPRAPTPGPLSRQHLPLVPLAKKVVFTGDTLFAGSAGRTDLHRSSFTSLIRSLGVFLAMPSTRSSTPATDSPPR